MRNLIRYAALTSVLLLLIVLRMQGQSGSFDVQAYQQYLAQHANIGASQLQAEHPAPLFFDGVTIDAGKAEWLDSISVKYQLTAEEKMLIEKNGFMVSERLRSETFQRAFGDVWMKDMPVFISTDAILHALHMSYEEILKYLETEQLTDKLADVLRTLWSYQSTLESQYGSNPALAVNLQDLDVYLTVAKSLLFGAPSAPYYQASQSKVEELLPKIDQAAPASVELFSSTPRTVDFSQFTVRGHYLDTYQLGWYFKAMMWLGRIEFMLTTPIDHVTQQTPQDIQRQIIDAALLLDALEKSGAQNKLKEIDEVLQSVVGESDNITVPQLRDALDIAGITDVAALLDTANVSSLQNALSLQPGFTQRINSRILMSDPMDPEQVQPATAFLPLGQRFVIDSYVLSNVVYDRIESNHGKVKRMKPSVMDVLFATGNNAAAQLLEEEMARYPYAQNLNGLRYLVDSYGGDFWNMSIYNGWLDAIRTLASPASVDEYPEFMRTGAWWQEKMNTQLAAWAQLRHDNILYAKPSYSGGATCSYPHAYVEPIPAFYERMRDFASDAAQKFDGIGFPLAVEYFNSFSGIMDTLGIIATKELANEALSAQEEAFVKAVLFLRFGCATDMDGWYTDLFFAKWLALEQNGWVSQELVNVVTADVHTVPTDEHGIPVGWVMHVGTGLPNMGVFVVENGEGQSRAYVGPVMSFYEEWTDSYERLNDDEWKRRFNAGELTVPAWTHSYLLDGEGKRRPSGPTLHTGVPVKKQPWLHGVAEAPVITASLKDRRYDPMPFPLTLTVRNEGTALTDSVYARIILPPALKLDGAPEMKLLQPAQLFPDEGGSVQWMLRHDQSGEAHDYTVRLLMVSANADTASCEVLVHIPALRLPVLSATCAVPDTLRYDEAQHNYTPNPFTVSLQCVNRGNGTAKNVVGTITLPPHVVLDPATQPTSITFTPEQMDAWEIGDPVPEVSWTVRWNDLLRQYANPHFQFSISGEDEEGNQLEQAVAEAVAHVPGVQPEFTVSFEGPDSLMSTGYALTPNPFTVRASVLSTSDQTGAIRRIKLNISSAEGITLDSSSVMPLECDTNIAVQKDENVELEWKMRADLRPTPRHVRLLLTLYDDLNTPHTREIWLPVAAVHGLFLTSHSVSSKIVHCDSITGNPDPQSLRYTMLLHNQGGIPLHNVRATVKVVDNSGLDLIEIDPSSQDTSTSRLQEALEPSDAASFSWDFRVKNVNTTATSQHVEIYTVYQSDETPWQGSDSSWTSIEFAPCSITGIDDGVRPTAVLLHPCHPNPFSTRSTVTFDMDVTRHARLSVFNMLGREVAVLVDGRLSAGRHQLEFHAGSLPAGMYLLRLVAGESMQVQRMQLRR
ncbi:DUF3160 domain-containing protein [bacterium]|nr:DUF3160 domain-containing protein [bacterium]